MSDKLFLIFDLEFNVFRYDVERLYFDLSDFGKIKVIFNGTSEGCDRRFLTLYLDINFAILQIPDKSAKM